MHARRLLKRLAYGTYPLYRGWFPYFGQAVYFPSGSHLFNRACAEGVYEQQIANLLTSLAKPHTTFMDVGANIGLLSIPVLAHNADVRVISIEASPHTARHLKQTWQHSRYRDRWWIVDVAVGRSDCQAQFWSSGPKNSAFDGLKDTGRGGPKQAITVDMQTLDHVWRHLEAPPVSVVKIDVEGGERDVLFGGREMIAREKPALIVEWSRLNLPAYGIEGGELLYICRDLDYRIYTYPSLCFVDNSTLLDAAMSVTETFLLLPMRV
jgi:FkbM family methyltransferase